MHFCLIDAVLEQSPDRIVALKRVSAAEEYLQDHFPTFPILPGVLMIEAMAQAGRLLLAASDPAGARWTLGGVRGIKFGAMVRPGDTLRIEVTLVTRQPDGAEFRAAGEQLPAAGDAGRIAVAGKFTLRPARTAAPAPSA